MIDCTFENGTKASLRHIVVHAIVEKDGKLLLEKRAENLLEGGKWSLPAGFLNRDESVGEGMLREIKEETGWVGEIVSVFRINTNPNRPGEDRQNIAIEFIVRAIEKVGEGDKESTEVEWFAIDQLPPLEEMAFDHGEAISLYLKYRRNKFSLPIFQ